ncbi:MAG: hypothetical protein JNK45_24440 [Myxococcales bacterium]|nr:hypothetical protein [Myxococcales bacterium]
MRTPEAILATTAFALLGAAGCASDEPGLGESDESGFLSEALHDDGGPDDGVESWGDGELRGILTFSFYPADALTGRDNIGIAGAWHTDEARVEEIDDFYSVFALQTAFPLPPEDDDVLEQNDIPAGFDWGDRDEWSEAGTAFKLASGDAEVLACLLHVGNALDLYPVYASTNASTVEECIAQPTDWIPGADYDLVMYGGELFPTQVLLGPVEAPVEFAISEPAFESYNAEIPQGDDLQVEWDGQGGSRDRMIIRVWDDLNRMFTIRAEDDGRYDIPADALALLEPGPITISVARERIERIPFAEGGVKVVTRYERRGYFDLIAAAAM